jgi:hypothetical protein
MRIDLDLQLLGTPEIKVNGQNVTVSPSATFELLCLIIVSGKSGISRKEASQRLWSHLEPKNALALLRINLMKLRHHDAVAGLLDVGTQQLKVLPHVNVSVDINRTVAPTEVQLSDFIQPVATPWNREHWQPETDLYASKLASWLETMGDDVAIQTVQAAHSSFPDNYRLATHLVRRLRGAERFTEANEVVIRFEDAWVERFGVAEIPTISISGKPDSQTISEILPPSSLPHQTHSKPSHSESILIATAENDSLLDVSKPKTITHLVPAVCLFAAVVAVAFALARAEGLDSPPKLAIADVATESGFEIRNIQIEGADPKDFSPSMSLGQRPMLQYRNQFCELEKSGKITPFQRLTWMPADANGTTTMEISPDSSLLKISTSSISYSIQPVKDFPYFDGPMVVTDGCVIFNRLCGHPFRDHRKICYWKNGAAIPIRISTPEPQNAVVTCKTSRGVYGKYSMGKSDGWKYHSFYFDFQSQKTQVLDIPPVIAELGDSVLVRPEITDVVRGDYQNHALDYALVIDKSGRQRKISLTSNADVIGTFGEYIYVCRQKTQFTSELEFLDFNLERVNPFPSLPREVEAFRVRSESVATCIGFDHERNQTDLLLLSKS